MPEDTPPSPPRYLTTREVADLIRVKERKVYDLAAAGEIPHRRITGKLLFPAQEVTAWIEGSGSAPAAPRPPVVSGSHDPLLDWALREAGAGLATLWNGSLDGVARFAAGEAALAALHIPEAEGWNCATVAAEGLRDAVLIGWANRARGLILAEGLQGRVRGIADLVGLRVVRRQAGSGAAVLFQRWLTAHGLAEDALAPAGPVARTETDAAGAVAAGEADVALGIQAMAGRFRLPFLPIVEERVDLLIDRRAYFTPPIQRVLTYAASPAVAEKAATFGGYDLSPLGTVAWLSP